MSKQKKLLAGLVFALSGLSISMSASAYDVSIHASDTVGVYNSAATDPNDNDVFVAEYRSNGGLGETVYFKFSDDEGGSQKTLECEFDASNPHFDQAAKIPTAALFFGTYEILVLDLNLDGKCTSINVKFTRD